MERINFSFIISIVIFIKYKYVDIKKCHTIVFNAGTKLNFFKHFITARLLPFDNFSLPLCR